LLPAAMPRRSRPRLGHSSVTMTLDRYGHLMEGLDTDAAERLGALRQTAWRRPGGSSGAESENGKAGDPAPEQGP